MSVQRLVGQAGRRPTPLPRKQPLVTCPWQWTLLRQMCGPTPVIDCLQLKSDLSQAQAQMAQTLCLPSVDIWSDALFCLTGFPELQPDLSVLQDAIIFYADVPGLLKTDLKVCT